MYVEDIYFIKKYDKLIFVGEKKIFKVCLLNSFYISFVLYFFFIGIIKNCEFVNNYNY